MHIWMILIRCYSKYKTIVFKLKSKKIKRKKMNNRNLYHIQKIIDSISAIQNYIEKTELIGENDEKIFKETLYCDLSNIEIYCKDFANELLEYNIEHHITALEKKIKELEYQILYSRGKHGV